jgi:hypothetical protein
VMVSVPVGVVVSVLEVEATVIVIASLAPDAGVLLAADRVVLEAVNEEAVVAGQAVSNLYRSTEPRPEASS